MRWSEELFLAEPFWKFGTRIRKRKLSIAENGGAPAEKGGAA